MRFMVMVKGDKNSEAGKLPTHEELAEMGTFNDQLVKAGIMLAGEGLQATSKGMKVRYDGTKRTVIDGPFTEAKEVVAGFWIWQVRSRDEALEWAKRIPFREGEVEIRQVFEDDDFGAEFTPELRAQEARQREAIARKATP
ncbi:MAG: YciI family protein [Gemmatimonadales bacterium]|nr:YciI family protein [Gemmatimonadales bacterium]